MLREVGAILGGGRRCHAAWSLILAATGSSFGPAAATGKNYFKKRRSLKKNRESVTWSVLT